MLSRSRPISRCGSTQGCEVARSRNPADATRPRRRGDRMTRRELSRCSAARRTAAVRQLCKRAVDVDPREDSMGAVWAYVEYGRNSNLEIGLKTTESGANNSIGIDGIDVQPAIVLF